MYGRVTLNTGSLIWPLLSAGAMTDGQRRVIKNGRPLCFTLLIPASHTSLYTLYSTYPTIISFFRFIRAQYPCRSISRCESLIRQDLVIVIVASRQIYELILVISTPGHSRIYSKTHHSDAVNSSTVCSIKCFQCVHVPIRHVCNVFILTLSARIFL